LWIREAWPFGWVANLHPIPVFRFRDARGELHFNWAEQAFHLHYLSSVYDLPQF